MRNTRIIVATLLAVFVGVALIGSTVALAAQQMKDQMHGQMKDHQMMGMTHTSKPFAGPKANKGTVSHSTKDGKSILTLSDDFVVPATPDPHWRVVDSQGNVYDLDKLTIKPDMPSKPVDQMMQDKMMGDKMLKDKYKKSIVLPAYIKDVKKVIIWCAWAETNLGEASFDQPVM